MENAKNIQFSYNAIGQLAANDLGAFAEAYTYNVRGAMTKRKSDVFEQTISFSNHFDRLYNGSIGMITDKLTGGKSTSSGYSYDNAGRLTSAMIFLDGITRPTGYTYDLNGNITALNRLGYNPPYMAERIDDLVYQYDGNKVRKITEKAPVVISEKTMNFIDGADEEIEYTYDRNGNMTSDANKGISLFWDANNRLSKVENDEMTMSFGRTGSGTKLSKNVYTGPRLNPTYPGLHRSNSLGGYPFFPRDSVPVIPGDSVISVNTTTLTEYFGAYEYENGKFSRLNTATGYRDSLGVHVYVRDWQGNIRAVVRRNAQGVVELEQATYYYPYGMPMAESTNPTINKYKYTGKELLTDHALNLYDYGARFYDPATCLWLSPDPHSADYSPISHYSMCAGDPINHIDPDGKDYFLFDEKGNLLEQVKMDGFDMTAMRTEDGYEFGPVFEGGTISVRETIADTDSETGQSVNADMMDVKGDANGKDLHEFLSDNGTVEFTRFETGDTGGDNAANIISTSHQTDRDNGAWHAANYLNHAKSNVRTMTHNHPQSTPIPSSYDLNCRDDWSSNSQSFENTNFRLYIKPSAPGYRGHYIDYTHYNYEK